MAYNEFSLETAVEKFGLTLTEDSDFFAAFLPTPISEMLAGQLAENVSLAQDISTEKARSELIVMPVLLEARRQLNRQISVFSGVAFNVAPELGLVGICDFLLSLSPGHLLIQAPVVSIVEAKNDNLKSGLGQCVAEMVAAQKFNEGKENEIPILYGIVTTGVLWRFLYLQKYIVGLDSRERSIDAPESIVGILTGAIRRSLLSPTVVNAPNGL